MAVWDAIEFQFLLQRLIVRRTYISINVSAEFTHFSRKHIEFTHFGHVVMIATSIFF